MPVLTIENGNSATVPAGKRLINAMTEDAQADCLHACGGNARCTTCRVEFISGEPTAMTVAERDILAARGVTSGRLSCQILIQEDMTVRVMNAFSTSGRVDAGKKPADEIAPPPVWV
jgi:ferredoxin